MSRPSTDEAQPKKARTTRNQRLKDVAVLAGVSEATASRALRNTRNVDTELRGRVLDAAEKLNFAPNPHARALASSRDMSIGVIVHDISDPYFSEIVRGALEGAAGSGRMLLICNTYRDAAQELAYIRHFRAQRADALLLAGSAEGDAGKRIAAEIAQFERSGGRAVLLGRYPATRDAIMPDNIVGARQMADHLVELGHRRIGVIAGPEGLTASRLSGLRDRLAELGVQLPLDHVRVADFTREGGKVAADSLIDEVAGLTAIFALNDVMAIGVLAGLRDRGISVPNEMSVAGFDDIPIAQDLQPALTTVRVPMFEMGRRAAADVLGPRSGKVHLERLPTALVVRSSTGAPLRRAQRRPGSSKNLSQTSPSAKGPSTTPV